MSCAGALGTAHLGKPLPCPRTDPCTKLGALPSRDPSLPGPARGVSPDCLCCPQDPIVQGGSGWTVGLGEAGQSFPSAPGPALSSSLSCRSRHCRPGGGLGSALWVNPGPRAVTFRFSSGR